MQDINSAWVEHYFFYGVFTFDKILQTLQKIKWLQLDSNPEPLRLVWLNGWVFVYELSGSGVWIHSETRMWHDKNIQLQKIGSFFLSTHQMKFF